MRRIVSRHGDILGDMGKKFHLSHISGYFGNLKSSDKRKISFKNVDFV